MTISKSFEYDILLKKNYEIKTYGVFSRTQNQRNYLIKLTTIANAPNQLVLFLI